MANYAFETKAIHGGSFKDGQTGSTVTPIYQTAAFSYESAKDLEDVFHKRKPGYIYSRISNPTVLSFESVFSSITNALGSIAVNSGESAIQLLFNVMLEPGDHVVASQSLFAGTNYLFDELSRSQGVSIDLVDIKDIDVVKASISDKTKFVFTEIIGNPSLTVPDLQILVDTTNAFDIPLVVDATLATPYLCDLKKYGVALGIYSGTKYIAPGSSTIGGVLVDFGTFDWSNVSINHIADRFKESRKMAFLSAAKKLCSDIGVSMAPFDAFLLNLGLESLSLRIERQCENARALATFFSQQKSIIEVGYPGLKNHVSYNLAAKQFNNRFGALLTIKLVSKEACFTFIDSLKLAKLVTNLGDNKTLVIHPDSTIYHQRSESEKVNAGVFSNLVRISVGIENIEDLKHDFLQALQKIGGE